MCFNQSQPGHSSSSFIQRSFDRDISLTSLLHILQKLAAEHQIMFAFLMNVYSDGIIRNKGRQFFKDLEWEKLLAIYKAKSSRRWYDQEPTVAASFHKLYDLSVTEQSNIAQSLHVPARLVQLYENYCKSYRQLPDIDVVYTIIATSFKDGPEKASEIFSVLNHLPHEAS